MAGASALTIVPRRVLGGPGYIAPSDMVLLAQVGCGTQAQRQVNAGMVTRPDLQFVAVVDPNKDSQNYVDWDQWGNRNRIRKVLDDPSWGESHTGIRAGRDVARQIMETLLPEAESPARGIRSYEDFREMLEKESDIQGVVNITPDHQHGPINIAALRKGKAAISHKPVASVLHEVRRTVQAARESAAPSHLLAYSNHPDRHLLAAWIDAGVIGTIREVHNWTNRPFWPQGMQEYHASGPAGARRVQLGAVAGARARSRRTIPATPSRSIEAGTRTAPAALATWATTACGSRTASSISASRSSSKPGPTTTRSSTSTTSATADACRRSPSRRRARSGGGIRPRRGARRWTRSGTTAA